MKKKNTFLIIAGFLCLGTAFLHTIGGQLDLVNPLLQSNLTEQAKAEWLGVWHMVTIVLFGTALYILKSGFKHHQVNQSEALRFIGVLYILFSIPFIASSIYMNLLAPQFILTLPIGILILFGIRKKTK